MGSLDLRKKRSPSLDRPYEEQFQSGPMRLRCHAKIQENCKQHVLFWMVSALISEHFCACIPRESIGRPQAQARYQSLRVGDEELIADLTCRVFVPGMDQVVALVNRSATRQF